MLEEVLHDELGSYRTGSWLRNPPASVHRPTAGYPRSKWIGCVSNNQARDTRQFLNCLSPQWRNALIATGSLMTSGQHREPGPIFTEAPKTKALGRVSEYFEANDLSEDYRVVLVLPKTFIFRG